MFTLSNLLSILRGPLAFLFLFPSPQVRASAILIAMISDCFDGYLARRYKHTTRLGAILDPLMDKIFVLLVLSFLYFEGSISSFDILALLCRDIALFIFGIILLLRGQWRTYNYQSMTWGKITTVLQFPVLFCFALGVHVPTALLALFYPLSLLILIELFLKRPSPRTKNTSN